MNMMKKKKLFRQALHRCWVGAVVSITLVSGLQAQNQTSSPYSRFGIGDLLTRNFGAGEAMGGLGMGLSERNNINLLNPAGIGQMDSLQFILEVSGSNRLARFATTDLQKTTNNLTFDYLGMGFPIRKWWKSSVGIMPYSGVGYTMKDQIDDPDIGQVGTEFTGEGGISRFFIQQTIHPVKYLSLGVTFSYLFGPVSHSKTLLFPEDSSFFSTRSTSTAIVGDIHLTYGAQLHVPLNNDYFFHLGGVFENQTNLKTESRQLVYSSGQNIVDTLFYATNPDNSIRLPMAYGGGFSFGKTNHFRVGADLRVQNWQQALFLGYTDSLANSQELIVGAEYIPDALSPNAYYKRIKYRAGFRYGKSYIQLRNTQLNEFGITFGAGMPIRADRYGRPGSLNISAEIGKRGTVDNNLISEVYGLLSVQISLRDVWFVKLKYD